MPRTLWFMFITCLCSLGGASARAAQQANPRDEGAIQKLHEDFMAAWNRGDTKAMAGEWATDGDLINPAGRVARGSTEVEKIFDEEQRGAFKGTRFTHDCDAPRLLRPDVAEVDCRFKVTNINSPNAQQTSMSGLHTQILVKQGGAWKIQVERPMVPVPLASAPMPATPPAPRLPTP